MKKRASSGPYAPAPSSPEEVGKRRVTPKDVRQAGDDPGVIVVPAAQFDALLTLLDDPPGVSDELRREIASRRWA